MSGTFPPIPCRTESVHIAEIGTTSDTCVARTYREKEKSHSGPAFTL